jgi:hypothetical protein
MNTQVQTPMLDMFRFIRQHVTLENLYALIWEDKGSASVDFLKGIT